MDKRADQKLAMEVLRSLIFKHEKAESKLIEKLTAIQQEIKTIKGMEKNATDAYGS